MPPDSDPPRPENRFEARMQYACLLFDQERYEQAEKELRELLSAEETFGLLGLLSLLSMCLFHQNQFDEALTLAQDGVGKDAENPFAHFALAWALHAHRRPEEAESSIREALRLDSQNADFHQCLATIQAAKRRWLDALDVTEQGLAVDPEHTGCAMLRAEVLILLERRPEATDVAVANLAANPDNPWAHVACGWALLAEGKAGAAEHFREALRLQPGNDFARRGLKEAQKANGLFYRLLLVHDRILARVFVGGFYPLVLLFVVLVIGFLKLPLHVAAMAALLPLAALPNLIVMLPLSDGFYCLTAKQWQLLSSEERKAALSVSALLALSFVLTMAALVVDDLWCWLAAALAFGLAPVALRASENVPREDEHDTAMLLGFATAVALRFAAFPLAAFVVALRVYHPDRQSSGALLGALAGWSVATSCLVLAMMKTARDRPGPARSSKIDG